MDSPVSWTKRTSTILAFTIANLLQCFVAFAAQSVCSRRTIHAHRGNGRRSQSICRAESIDVEAENVDGPQSESGDTGNEGNDPITEEEIEDAEAEEGPEEEWEMTEEEFEFLMDQPSVGFSSFLYLPYLYFQRSCWNSLAYSKEYRRKLTDWIQFYTIHLDTLVHKSMLIYIYCASISCSCPVLGAIKQEVELNLNYNS